MGPVGKVVAALGIALVLVACVEHHPHRDAGEQALVRSWFDILEVDGEPPEDPYLVTLPPGEHSLLVRYRTFRAEYLCRFEFSAVGGYSYDVVDHSNTEPLVLYRWSRANGAWAERSDPVLPDCTMQSPDQL